MKLKREDAKHDGFVCRIAGTDCGHHGLAERIEGARADVAVDDTDRAERERPKPCLGLRGSAPAAFHLILMRSCDGHLAPIGMAGAFAPFAGWREPRLS